MCLYEPPLFLGEPDLSAAVICTLPLAISATRWAELLSALVGLSTAFLIAHLFILTLPGIPPTSFYSHGALLIVVPISVAIIAFDLAVVFALARFVSGLWRRQYQRAFRYLLLALALVGLVACVFLYVFFWAHGLETRTAGLLAMNVSPSLPAYSSNDAGVIVGCRIPPFGEGMVGYSMLAVLVVFEILVAFALAELLNQRLDADRP